MLFDEFKKPEHITVVTVTKLQRAAIEINLNIRCCYFKRDDRHLQSKLLADRVSLLLLLPYSYYSGHSIWNHKWVKFWCHHKAVIMWIIKNSKIEFTGPTWDWVYYNITKFHFRFVLKYENLDHTMPELALTAEKSSKSFDH